ncbi:MAG: alpha-1,4-glucan--maltose-1-phosphate maltosyltransferase [Bacteroidota bacterium]
MSQSRVILENLSPELNAGRYFIKRVVGDTLSVAIDLYGDGHDVVNGRLLYRHEKQRKWRSVAMTHRGNDRWGGAFALESPGTYEYKVEGWVDYGLNWQHEIERKIEGGQTVAVELLDGVQYLDYLQKKVAKGHKKQIKEWAALFADESRYAEATAVAVSEELHALFQAHPERRFVVEYPARKVFVDRKKAEFSTWYELFPRSASSVEGQHGSFKDVEKLLPRIAEFGFDTLYMPPIHPIGRVHRKGKNNSVTAEPGEPGSCWGVGAKEGGHTALLPELGTLKDFKRLIKKALEHDIEIAMDIAFQCAPDHPWVKAHPEWFRWRPDGSVQYAENPPKKYQDILPIYFETPDWKNLWQALTDVVLYWMEQGVRVFRIDNPHTKPYRFWEHLIAECKKKDPGVIFLSEAFTRPAVMHQLAKVGFSQSYSYYTWRNTKAELIAYLTELTQGPGRDYFRANFWPNTPDILPWALQSGQEPVFLTRLFMAGTLNSNYGLYGPVYEFMVHEAVPGKEEYWDSEKYEIRHWDWEKRNKITHVMTRMNQARKDNPALQAMHNLQFCTVENENILAWYKSDSAADNHLLMVVNIDPYYTQSGWVQTPLSAIGIAPGQEFTVHDLISGNSYLWNQEWNYVELNPFALPFHLFRIEKP